MKRPTYTEGPDRSWVERMQLNVGSSVSYLEENVEKILHLLPFMQSSACDGKTKHRHGLYFLLAP